MSACKRGNDPNHGGGFEVVRNLDAAYIDRIPTEVFATARDIFFCMFVFTAEKHVWRAAPKVRLVKVCVPYGKAFTTNAAGRAL